MSAGELLYSNLCLLGYEKETSGPKITLSDDMFNHSNERAFESVVHFLLRVLDEERTRLTFRNCWPVLEKRQSCAFRQAVIAWLKEIRQNEPDGAGLPIVNASLFLSPGGRKFKQLLLALTHYVMLKTLRSLDQQTPGADVILSRGNPNTQCGTLRAACALAKEHFVRLQQSKLICHTNHQRFSDSFCSTYRRLRQRADTLVQELGRLVAASDLPPELTHRLLQQSSDQVVPAVMAAARQHLSTLAAGQLRLRQFCGEAEYSWQVADSIVSGAVARSVIDATELVAPPTRPGSQDDSAAGDVRMDLVAFFETFVSRVRHLQQILTHCPIGQLKGLHTCLPPLVFEAEQLAVDSVGMLAELQTEFDAVRRHVDTLVAADRTPPRSRPRRAGSASPPPLLAPRTPSWSLTELPPLPSDQPLRQLRRPLLLDDSDSQASGDVAADRQTPGLRVSSEPTEADSGRWPWTSPSTADSGGLSRPSVTLTDSSPVTRCDGSSPAGRANARISSCSSLFSPLAGGAPSDADTADTADASASLSSVTSLAEFAEPASGFGCSPFTESVGVLGCSPSAELVRLRQRTSALLNRLTGSPLLARYPPAQELASGSTRVPSNRELPSAVAWDTSAGDLASVVDRDTGDLIPGVARDTSAWELAFRTTRGPSGLELAAAVARDTSARELTSAVDRDTSVRELASVVARDTSVRKLAPAVAKDTSARKLASTIAKNTSAGELVSAVVRDTSARELASVVTRDTSAGELLPGSISGRGRDSSARRLFSDLAVDASAREVIPGSVSDRGRNTSTRSVPVDGCSGHNGNSFDLAGMQSFTTTSSGPPTPGTEHAGVSATDHGGEPVVDCGSYPRQLQDQVAEELTMHAFGSLDFDNSVRLSPNRESLGGVEISLVSPDDSDDSDLPCRVDPPTDVLVDI